MDLRSVLNSSDAGAPAAKQHQPPPPQQQQPPPSRPSQSPAQYGTYREYPPGPHPHQSPGRPVSTEHTPSQQHQYPSQASPYQTPGPYPRAAPPPLQSVNSFQHDSRSPSGSMPAPSPSPYRHPPTPSAGQGAPREYPFPVQGHQEITSPVQRQQYPPAQQFQHQRQDSYPQGAPTGPSGPYGQAQQHTIPQTPPVGTSGGAPQFPPHQRSHSTHSTTTPTSAHSQQHHGPPYHGSPVSATQQQPSVAYPRQPSQPPTPGGGQPLSHPVASARPPVGGVVAEGPYKQPASPYSQRIVPPNAPPTQTQPSPHMSSHPPPGPQRSSTSHSAFGSPIAEAHPRPQYLREREQSLSVSPKTRVNPLPPNHAEIQQHPQQHQHHQAPEHDHRTSYPQTMALDPDRNVTPAKRKMEDRDISPQDMERKQARTIQSEVNGQHHASRATTVKSESPAAPKKRRLRRAVPPRWAQSVEILKGGLPKHPNYVLQKRKPAHLNGSRHSTSASKPQHASRSRHASPEASRSTQPAPAVAQPEGPQDILGPWEPCLTGIKPYEEVSKLVADFLFLNVISCQDFREIQSLGIQFEIEAKLGTVIDRRTNHRVDLGAASECLLEDTQVFKSSMSEENHKGFNDFLNDIVVHAHPKRSGGSRVPVEYKHRREVDRFYDLTPEQTNRLPACMRARFTNNKRPRVRITHDQQSKELLGKIVKARVADLDLHMPKSVMDCRLSINLEMNWDGAVEDLEKTQGADRQPDRNKDRLSYSQGHYQVDLTQVTQTTTQGPKKEHELEIELAAGILIDQGRKAMNGAPHRYPELIEGFIDNVRLLARKARDV